MGKITRHIRRQHNSAYVQSAKIARPLSRRL